MKTSTVVLAICLVLCLANVLLSTSYIGIQKANYLIVEEGASPGTPAAGLIHLYGASSDKAIHSVDSTGADVAFGTAALVTSYISGFMVATTVADGDTWSVGSGIARDRADSADLAYNGILTGDLDVSGANGLDTADITSKAIDTWYSIWVICDSTGPTYATLASTSGTAPSMPAGYTLKRRVGWLRTRDVGGGGVGFHDTEQDKGERIRYTCYAASCFNRTVLNGGISLVIASIDCSSYSPSTALRVDLYSFVNSGSFQGTAWANWYGNKASQAGGPGSGEVFVPYGYGTNGSMGGVVFELETGGAQTVYYCVNNANVATYAYVMGYYDDLSQ